MSHRVKQTDESTTATRSMDRSPEEPTGKGVMIMKLAESTTLRQHCSKVCKDVRKGGRKEH